MTTTRSDLARQLDRVSFADVRITIEAFMERALENKAEAFTFRDYIKGMATSFGMVSAEDADEQANVAAALAVEADRTIRGGAPAPTDTTTSGGPAAPQESEGTKP